MTTVNIAKLYLGVGILAFPFGFKNCGLHFTAFFIVVVTIINTYSQMIQVDCKNQFGKKCKTYSDLAEHIYGRAGRQFAAFHIISLTVMCCMAYVLFFIEQLDWVLIHSTEGVWSDNKNFLFVIAIMILTLIYLCESMKTLSFISMFAMSVLTVGLCLVMFGAADNITTPKYDKTIQVWNPWGIFYFFGTAIFAFEGNAVILEVHHQCDDKPKFKLQLVVATTLVLIFYLALGMFCYVAFGQFTKPFILLNMAPNGLNYIVQLLYVIGILCTSPLLMVPVFKILEHSSFYDLFPEKEYFPNSKRIIMRQTVMMGYAIIAYFIPNLNQFLNFIGGINGTFLVFIMPVMFYLKVFAGKIGVAQRMWLYFMLIFGTTGGLISVITALNALLFTGASGA